jgi:hypothetical protein
MRFGTARMETALSAARHRRRHVARIDWAYERTWPGGFAFLHPPLYDAVCRLRRGVAIPAHVAPVAGSATRPDRTCIGAQHRCPAGVRSTRRPDRGSLWRATRSLCLLRGGSRPHRIRISAGACIPGRAGRQRHLRRDVGTPYDDCGRALTCRSKTSRQQVPPPNLSVRPCVARWLRHEAADAPSARGGAAHRTSIVAASTTAESRVGSTPRIANACAPSGVANVKVASLAVPGEPSAAARGASCFLVAVPAIEAPGRSLLARGGVPGAPAGQKMGRPCAAPKAHASKREAASWRNHLATHGQTLKLGSGTCQSVPLNQKLCNRPLFSSFLLSGTPTLHALREPLVRLAAGLRLPGAVWLAAGLRLLGAGVLAEYPKRIAKTGLSRGPGMGRPPAAAIERLGAAMARDSCRELAGAGGADSRRGDGGVLLLGRRALAGRRAGGPVARPPAGALRTAARRLAPQKRKAGANARTVAQYDRAGARHAGVLMLFIWGPPQPTFEEGVPKTLELGTPLPGGKTVGEHNEETRCKKVFYKRMSGIGLGLIGVGFAFQLWAVWV